MTYKVELTETAEEHLKEWAKSGQKKVLSDSIIENCLILVKVRHFLLW